MWELLSPPASSLEVTIAAWTTAAAGLTTVALFCATLALRFATVASARRRHRIVERWRGIFAAAMLSESAASESPLPRYRRRERAVLLEEWNRARESVEGDAGTHLIVLAQRLGFGRLARRKLKRHRLSARLVAIQTLGHLRDRSEWDGLVALLDHPNTALSVTAAKALVDIDPREGARFVMPHVVTRADWPQATVSRVLRHAGPDLVTQPLCNAILTSDSATAVRLLKYAAVARTETMDQLVELLLRERQEPAVLTAAMKAISAGGSLPRITRLTRHEAWYVRMQAATLLGRVGDERNLPQLEELLRDREWWVRYRAAQAIVAMPGLGPNALRALRDRQSDHFAADMMQQAMAEAGLA
jgi:HEAT repeat protein